MAPCHGCPFGTAHSRSLGVRTTWRGRSLRPPPPPAPHRRNKCRGNGAGHAKPVEAGDRTATPNPPTTSETKTYQRRPPATERTHSSRPPRREHPGAVRARDAEFERHP